MRIRRQPEDEGSKVEVGHGSWLPVSRDLALTESVEATFSTSIGDMLTCRDLSGQAHTDQSG